MTMAEEGKARRLLSRENFGVTIMRLVSTQSPKRKQPGVYRHLLLRRLFTRSDHHLQTLPLTYLSVLDFGVYSHADLIFNAHGIPFIMSEGSGYLPDVTDYFESDSTQAIDIGSLDIEYLATCVRFAQSHGIFPTSQGSQLGTSFSPGRPFAPPGPLDQDQGTIFDTQNLDPNLVDDAYQDPLISNTSATTPDTQSNDSNNDDPQVGSIASQLHHTQNARSVSPAWNDFMIFDDDQMEEVADTSHHMFNPDASTTDTVNRESALDVGPSRTRSPGEEEDSDGQTRNKKQGLAILHNYDPFWVQKTGVDPRTVFEPRSKMKFEKLFLDGVIQEGDCLVIAVTCSMNQVARPDSAILTVLLPYRASFESIHY